MRDTLLSPIWLFGWMLLALLLASLRLRGSWLLRGGLALAWVVWWTLSAPVSADWALGGLEAVARQEAARCGAPPPGSMFIVLAGGLRENPASSDAVASLSSASLRRALAAESMASTVPGSRLLFSGGHGGRYTEAELMRQLALRLGFPAARIETDEVSLTTYESARNLSRRFTRGAHPPLYLVTSAYHMPRAYLAFHESGLKVCALPVDFEASHSLDPDQWIPTLQGLAMMSKAVHEFLGIPYYWVKLAGKAPG